MNVRQFVYDSLWVSECVSVFECVSDRVDKCVRVVTVFMCVCHWVSVRVCVCVCDCVSGVQATVSL